jgi:alkane 1-monooxygenase
VLLVGGSSGYSGIVVAHELIHRQERGMQWLGRALLCTVMYEHFYTEHLRGHHVRVGTPEDPATARFGESFTRFYLRTVPAQFRSAWRLEARRLGDEAMPLLDRRQLRNRVLHGVVAEWSLAFAILALCGAAAFAAFLLQAVFASRALEVVNYFEHWGLVRSTRRVRPVDSWDTHSRFTYYALTGLTRHADHHAYASRPYQQLRVQDEAPVLPRGYIAMFPLVLARNREFQRQMTEELRRRKLGPFAEEGA